MDVIVNIVCLFKRYNTKPFFCIISNDKLKAFKIIISYFSEGASKIFLVAYN